jgi:hypothetical protein
VSLTVKIGENRKNLCKNRVKNQPDANTIGIYVRMFDVEGAGVGFGFRVSGFGYRVSGFGFRLGIRIVGWLWPCNRPIGTGNARRR